MDNTQTIVSDDWPVEDSPMVIEHRIRKWLEYSGSEKIRMLQGHELRLLPGDDYSRTLFIWRRQHVGLLLGLARLDLSGTCVDIGANVGYISTWLANRSDVERVVAFEPNLDVAKVLRSNLSSRNGEVVTKFVGNKTGDAAFAIHPTNSGLSGLAITENEHNLVKVASVTLDEYFESESSTGRVGLIKIDVEGGDLDVLLGARDLIDRDRPVIVCEVNFSKGMLGRELKAIIKRSSSGYSAVTPNAEGFLAPDDLSNPGQFGTDVILVPEGLRVRN
jgi:FkbM family methyltransferase